MEAFLKKIIKEAGALGKEYFDRGTSAYTHKMDPDDILTEADKAVSTWLLAQIKAEFPDHAIFSETVLWQEGWRCFFE